MPQNKIQKWRHSHNFAFIQEKGELRTKQVLILTAATMIIEIIAGLSFGSMALLADGWHMCTHAAAFTITLFAYRYSRKHLDDRRFSFGTGKVSVLGGFASAAALVVVALVMVIESLERLVNPQVIHFNQAVIVAIFGLAVNLISALLLKERHHDKHEHGHHHDHNIRGAYLHVLADALTSVLAIIALCLGKYLNWYWSDPLIGIVGALMIARWSYGLLTDTSVILLDQNMDAERIQAIKQAVENDKDTQVSDIHVWKVGPVDYAVILSLATAEPQPPDHYKGLLEKFENLSHVTVEVNPCRPKSVVGKK